MTGLSFVSRKLNAKFFQSVSIVFASALITSAVFGASDRDSLPVHAPNELFSLNESLMRVKRAAYYGKWRGEFETRPGIKVPFNFEIADDNAKTPVVYFINGSEKFDAGKLRIEKDSLFVSLDQFDNELALKIDGKKLNGVLRKQDGTGNPLSLSATRDLNYRFTEPTTKPAKDISGTYAIVFKSANGQEEKAVGLFTQTGNKLQGTFLRVTGDSRFLEGVIDGNKFELSSFIGSSPSYYKGSFDNDGKINGEIVGIRGNSAFTGVPDESAELPDPYKLTYLKEGYSSLDFSFPDVDGRQVSLKDEKFKNKVVIVTIGGTWCPNCMDETMFLAPWYRQNKQKGVEIISLQYERKDDPAFVKNALSKYRTKFGVEYTQLFAGIADKQAVAASLPALNTFLSFPTMILIDKQGKVKKIHTGFSGPATGKYYDEFVKEFNEDMAQLLN